LSESRRLSAIDNLRGLIMVLMAIDHVSGFVARRHAAEFWGGAWTHYESAGWFLSRFVTHLCAPGFFFLMGTGLVLLASARQASGWSGGRVAGFLFKRGALLVAVNQLVENPAWVVGLLSGTVAGPAEPIPGGGGGPPFLVFTVLTGLGMCIMAGSQLLRCGDAVWWVVSAAALVGSAYFTPPPEAAGQHFSAIARLLFLPGQTGPVFVMYPLVPWFGLTGLGVLFGRWLERDRRQAFAAAPRMGFACCAAALLLRVAGGFGNLRLPRDGSWIEFFNFIKYPPALVFVFFLLGLNLMLLVWLPKVDWLVVIGQTPLFYYLAHLYLYAIVGAAFFRAGTGMAGMYAVWGAGLVPLYFGCRWYRGFKQAKPADSVWRFF
jgi:uncharacterized membrane protein